MAKYTEIITQAITNFDEIASALSKKSVTTTAEDGKAFEGINVNEYKTYIANQLWRVGNRNGADAPTNAAGVITDLAGQSITVTPSVEVADGKAHVVMKPTSAGYVEATTQFVGDLTATQLEISSLGSATADADGWYTLGTGAANLYSSAKIKKATVAQSLAYTGVTDGVATGTVTVESISVSGLTTASTSKDTEDSVVEIKITPVASVSGTIEVTPSYNNTVAGFLDAGKVDGTKETITIDGESLSASSEKSVYIKRASITGYTSTSGKPTLAAGSIASATEITGGYKITVNKPEQSISAVTHTEGYLDGESTVSGSIAADSLDIYVAKGAQGTVAAISKTAGLTADAGLTLVAEANKVEGTEYYGITSASSAKEDISIEGGTAGYVEAADLNKVVGSVQVTGETKYVAKGEAKVSVANKSVALSSTVGKATLADGESEADFVKIASAMNVSFGKTAKEGYIKAADITAPENITAEAGGSWYIGKGNVAPEITSLNATLVEVAHGDTTHNYGDIFLSTKPTDVDYFTIKASAGLTGKAGYISAISGTAEKEFYMPQAKLRYVTSDSGDDANFLEVSQAGFLPTGTLLDIGDISGTPDYAAVKATLTSEVLMKTGAAADAYAITISKGAVNPGYISSSNGTLELDSTYYINKFAGELSGTVATTIDETKISIGENGVTVPVQITSQVGLSTEGFTPGYIKSVDELTAINKTETKEVTLAEAELGLDKTTVKLEADADKSDITSQAEGYAIKFKVNDTIGAVTSKAGYATTAHTKQTPVAISAADTSETFYVKKGTTLTSVTGTAANADLTGPTKNANGKYVVTAPGETITVAGTLEEGYYKSAAEKAVSGSVAIADRTLELDQAKATATVTTTNKITAEGVAVSTSGSANHIAITAKATSTKAVTVGTAGYLGTADSANITVNAADASDTIYIEKYTTTTASVGADQDITADSTYAAQSTTLNTKDKYATSDVTVTIAADAMGANVYASLQTLLNRMNGVGVTITE